MSRVTIRHRVLIRKLERCGFCVWAGVGGVDSE